MVDGRIHVTAPGAKALEVNYTVKAVDKGDDAYGLIKDKYSGRMWTMTWPYNTGSLFPSNSAPQDGVTTRVTVKVGQGMEAVGTGTKGADGSFATKSQSPAYAFAFYAAKDFQLGDAGKSKDGVAVTGFGSTQVPRALRDAYLKTAKDSLDFYSSWLGKFDYGNTLKLVELEGGLGGCADAQRPCRGPARWSACAVPGAPDPAARQAAGCGGGGGSAAAAVKPDESRRQRRADLGHAGRRVGPLALELPSARCADGPHADTGAEPGGGD